MNKLDDFFKKSLEEAQGIPDAWNVPSELPWEQAKIYFPKAKKKKRILPWLFFGLGLVAISLLFVWNRNSSDLKSETVLHEANGIEKSNTEAEITIPKIITENVNQETQTENTIQEGNAANGIQEIEEENQKIENNKLESVAAVNAKQAIEKTKKISNEQLVNESRKEDSENISKTANNLSPRENKSITNSPIEKTVKVDKAREMKQLIEISPDLNELKNKKKRILFTELVAVESKLTSLEFNEELDIESSVKMDEIEPVFRKLKMTEIGLSYKLSPFSFKRIHLVDGMDEIDLTSNYTNVNFHFTKILGKHWRVSTGLFYSNVNAGLKFTSFFNFDPTLLDQTVSREVEAAVTQVQSKDSKDISINFLAGQEPEAGAELNIRGSLSLDWVSLQIPLFVNYYWTRPKMEYYIGAGTNLSFYNFNQTNVESDLYSENQIIAEKPTIEDVNLKILDLGLVLQTGFRRKITNQINLGLNVRVDFLNGIDSGIDIGVYYRWN